MKENLSNPEYWQKEFLKHTNENTVNKLSEKIAKLFSDHQKAIETLKNGCVNIDNYVSVPLDFLQLDTDYQEQYGQNGELLGVKEVIVLTRKDGKTLSPGPKINYLQYVFDLHLQED